ncbi:MAG: Host attachment protein, partial [Rhodobacteraceae bacterium]|nr:Host attachment protein [Paracoccaceae bacterium]
MALFANGMHVLVADGEKAMILVNDGTVDTPRLRLVDRIEQDLAAV